MVIAETIEQITDELIQPLCDETRRLFRRITNLKETDRIRIGMPTADSKHFRVSFRSTNEWGVASYAASNRFPTRIPEREYRAKSDSWKFAITDITAIIISYHWKPWQIEFEDDLAQIQFRYLLATFINQTASIKAREEISDFQYLDHVVNPLANCQKKALKASLFSEAFALFMEQGTGKTPVAIARMCNEALKYDGPGAYKVLVVCPSNVRTNWHEEFHKFCTVPGRATVIGGTELARGKQLIEALRAPKEGEKFTAAMISYDSLTVTDMARAVPWDLVVLDEAHYIKSSRTKRFKACLEVRDNCKKRMILTGTPIANTMFDLWSQLEFLGSGWSGFVSEKAFRRFYGEYVNTGQGQGYEKLTGLKNVPLIQERLARQSYLIDKKTALPDLPETSNNVIEVEFSSQQRKVYDQLCTQLMAEIESKLETSDNPLLVVNNVLTQMLRLAQITSGFVGIPGEIDADGVKITEDRIESFPEKPKLDALVEYLKGKNSHEKAIIWGCWNHDIDAIYNRLEAEGFSPVKYTGSTSDKDREEAKRRFNCDPSCRVFIGNAAAGGTGLNLLGYDHSQPCEGTPETYCDSVIYYSQNWSSTNRSQSEARAHRRGTKVPVVYTDLVVKGTIDEDIRERVLHKRESAASIQDVRTLVERFKKVRVEV